MDAHFIPDNQYGPTSNFVISELKRDNILPAGEVVRELVGTARWFEP